MYCHGHIVYCQCHVLYIKASDKSFVYIVAYAGTYTNLPARYTLNVLKMR